MSEIISQIKSSLDITDLIGERVRLRKAGRGFVGLCPFHNEDTPSFHVYSDSQSYYCFGCQESGDIFTWVMKTEALAFPEALQVLADKAGLKLESRRSSPDARNVLEAAEKFFTSCLNGPQGSAARAYLTRRQLDEADVKRFSLGCAPNSWDSLTNYLRKAGLTDKAILDAGLAVNGRHGLYDSFRGRVIFPIKDAAGRVIAFGGRLIDGEGAKYINSPESSSYSKRSNLYLIDQARKAIRDRGRSILVEGYMDAIRLHKCGFPETAASLGTSLTQEQAKILARYADKCYICYDADTAGQAAALRGMYILAENGLSVYVVSLPSGKDPDEFLCANPPKSFSEALGRAKPLVVHYVETLAPALKANSTRHAAVNELFANLKRLNLDEVLSYTDSICGATGLSPDAVEHLLLGGKILPPKKKYVPNTSQLYGRPPADMRDSVICALLRQSQACRLSLSPEEADKILVTDLAKDTARALLYEDPDEMETIWLVLEDLDKISLLKRGEAIASTMSGTPEEKFISVYCELKERSIERRMKEILSMPVEQRDPQELRELFMMRGRFRR